MSATITQRSPKALENLLQRLATTASKQVAVGFPKGKSQAYPDGTSVIDVAFRNNQGIGVPKRDFMGYAKPAIEEKTAPIMAQWAKEAVNPQGSTGRVEAMQKAAGTVAQDAIMQAIVDLQDPPNSPATIAKKGSSNPLIDTGHMRDSVTFEIRDSN
jgi:hypothetical protein